MYFNSKEYHSTLSNVRVDELRFNGVTNVRNITKAGLLLIYESVGLESLPEFDVRKVGRFYAIILNTREIVDGVLIEVNEYIGEIKKEGVVETFTGDYFQRIYTVDLKKTRLVKLNSGMFGLKEEDMNNIKLIHHEEHSFLLGSVVEDFDFEDYDEIDYVSNLGMKQIRAQCGFDETLSDFEIDVVGPFRANTVCVMRYFKSAVIPNSNFVTVRVNSFDGKLEPNKELNKEDDEELYFFGTFTTKTYLVNLEKVGLVKLNDGKFGTEEELKNQGQQEQEKVTTNNSDEYDFTKLFNICEAAIGNKEEEEEEKAREIATNKFINDCYDEIVNRLENSKPVAVVGGYGEEGCKFTAYMNFNDNDTPITVSNLKMSAITIRSMLRQKFIDKGFINKTRANYNVDVSLDYDGKNDFTVEVNVVKI